MVKTIVHTNLANATLNNYWKKTTNFSKILFKLGRDQSSKQQNLNGFNNNTILKDQMRTKA